MRGDHSSASLLPDIQGEKLHVSIGEAAGWLQKVTVFVGGQVSDAAASISEEEAYG